MSDKENLVLETMKKAGKPLRPGDIAELAKLDKEEVSAILNQLKQQQRITSPKRCFWEPTS